MPLEYKAIKSATMGIDDRTVTGIFAVHGNVDAGDGWSSRDRTHPNLFGDFSVAGRKRAVFLWQHNSHDPPTAMIEQLFEVAGADLPPAVKLYAPEATGGVAVRRTYLDTPRGNEVLAALRSGALAEMSYAYQPTRWDFEKTDDDTTIPIRNIYEAELFDVSDVNWGMNPATSADGSKHQPITTQHDTVLAAVADYVARYKQLSELRAKEGRVLSGENRKRIEACVKSLEEAATALQDLLAATEPKQSPPPDRTAARRLYADYMRTLARMNGVSIP